MFQVNLAQMNRKSFSLLLCLSCCFVSNVFCQSNSYYWSGNRRISLSVDSSTFILLGKSIKESEAMLSSIVGIKSQRVLRSDFVLVEISKENVSEIQKLKANILLKNFSYSFLSQSNKRVIPTGEILVHPKTGVSIASIISRAASKLKIKNESSYGDYTLGLEDNSDVLEVANSIYESGLVEFAHPDFIADIILNQNDPLFPDQFYLNNTGQFEGTAGIDINAPEAWLLSNGINNVRVAVIDDGVENHEDIDGRVLQGFTPRNANGFGAPLQAGNHGQQCAGIIASTTNNALGVAGITQCSQIIPINIFAGGETIQDLVAAIDWAWNQGQADVLSNSWSFNDPNAEFDQIAQAITRARTQGRGGLGSIVVFASGNNQQNFDGVMFPARANGVVTVGAIDLNGSIWNYSSRGAQMDLVAPSGNVNNTGNIRTTDRMNNNGLVAGNYVETFGGTSAACPQVSAVAAFMLSINPNLTEAQVVNILRSTATDMGDAGFDNTFGVGRLNAQGAILQVLPTISGNNLLCSTNSNYSLSFVPANANVTWFVAPTNLFDSGEGAFTSGNGPTATVRAASGGGLGTITFNIQGNCNVTAVTRSIWVGRPYDFLVSGPNLVTANSYNGYSAVPWNGQPSFTEQGVSSFTWSFPWVPTNAGWSCGGCSGEFVGVTAGPQSTILRAVAQSVCGTSTKDFEVFVQQENCPPGGCEEPFFVYPNPSSEELTISVNAAAEDGLSDITLVDSQGAVVYNSRGRLSNQIKIPVKELRNGLYFLRAVVNGVSRQHHVIIDH
jgi:serine protease